MQESHIDAKQDNNHEYAEVYLGNHVDNYELFMAALRNRLARKEKTQVDICTATGISTNYMSLLVRGKRRASDEKREAIAGVFGVSAREFINEGHLVTYGRPVDQPPAQTPPAIKPVAGVEAGWVEPMDVLSMVSSAVGVLAKQAQDESGRKRFWREMFDVLPMAAMVIKDGLIWYQNEKSRDWGNLKGVTLCDSCVCPGDCMKKHECPSFQAIETKTPRSGHQFIGSKYYKVDVVPLRNNYKGHQYFVILAAEEKEQPPDDRRSGVDRRTESFLPG